MSSQTPRRRLRRHRRRRVRRRGSAAGPPARLPPAASAGRAFHPAACPPAAIQSGGYPQYGGPPGPVRGHRGGRMGRGILIGVFAGVLAVVLGITAARRDQVRSAPAEVGLPGAALRPAAEAHRRKGSPGAPPPAPALHNFKPFTSPAGYELEFNPNLWTITDQNDSDVALELSINGISAVVQIRSEPFSGDTSADAAAVDARQNALGKDVLGLAADTKPADQILEPAVGYQSGEGAAFSGVADTPQGPGSPVAVVITAAHDDHLLDLLHPDRRPGEQEGGVLPHGLVDEHVPVPLGGERVIQTRTARIPFEGGGSCRTATC